MARKTPPKTPSLSEDQPSPAVGKKPVAKSRAPRVAKVGQEKAPVSKARTSAKPAAKPPKAAAKKPAAAHAPRSPQKEGSTKIPNPIELTEFELEALRIADSHGLDRRQQKFIDLWVVSQTAGQAYRDAGYKCKNDNVAAVSASKLLRKVKNHPYTKWRQAELFKRTADIQNEVIEQIRSAALADVRELVEYNRRCCRYCYGIDHLYQFKKHEMTEREAEYAQLKAQADTDNKVLLPMDTLGGTGFNPTLAPIDTCTNCFGEGIGRARFKDTANLSPGAVVLYEGVKEGKDGTEVKVASKKGYLEMLASIFDLKVEPEVKVTIGVSDEVLNGIYAEAEARTNSELEAMKERERRLAEGNPQ